MLSAVARWLSRRSLRFLHLCGTAAGWLTYAGSPTYRRRLQAHVRRAGVGAVAAREAIGSAGRMILELPFLWLRGPDQPITPWLRWEGVDLLEAALARAEASGRGLLLLTPHLGAFEVTAQAFAERYGARSPLTVLYRPTKQAALREMVEASRARPNLATAPASLAGVRQMMRALRRGEAVGLLPDQVPPEGMGVWAPFFGERAYTMTLAARLAQQTGAEIVLLYCERLPRGAGYVVHVAPFGHPLPDGAPNDEVHQIACAEQINRAMEGLILRLPGQYLWAYNRYKSPRRLPAASAES